MQADRIGIGTPLQKSYSKKKCPNCSTKFDIYNAELQNYIDGNIVWKREDIAYCRNCKEFFFTPIMIISYIGILAILIIN